MEVGELSSANHLGNKKRARCPMPVSPTLLQHGNILIPSLTCSHSRPPILQLNAIPSLLLDATNFFFHMPQIGELDYYLILRFPHLSTSRILTVVLAYDFFVLDANCTDSLKEIRCIVPYSFFLTKSMALGGSFQWQTLRMLPSIST